jgi:predicted esterase
MTNSSGKFFAALRSAPSLVGSLTLAAVLCASGAWAQGVVGGLTDTLIGVVNFKQAQNIRDYWTTPEGALIKFDPPVAGDPVLEVLLPPGLSGHPTLAESFKIQFPLKIGQIPVDRRAMVIGFHHYGVSEQALFNPNTSLPQICAQKGWLLLAPRGLNQVNFANEPSQKSLEAVLDFVDKYFDWNTERMYGVGFSMGGLNALSFGLRHQDPGDWRLAGVIAHMSTVDPIYAYANGSAELMQIMQMPIVFGGSPTALPFNYERVTAGKITAGNVIDSLFGPSVNLLDTRVYISINQNDPETDLKIQSDALANYLSGEGLDVFVKKFNGSAVHSWSTLDDDAAIAWIESGLAPGAQPINGPPVELFADRVGTYRFTEVRALTPDKVARYNIVEGSAGSNSFGILGTRAVLELAIDTEAINVHVNQALSFTTWSTDGTAPTFVIKNFPQWPTSVLVNGLAPAALNFNPQTKELSVRPTNTGQFCTVAITP